MRDIKFRGKRLYNDEWVYGFVAKIDCYENGKQYEETVIVDQLKYDDRDYYVQEFIYADAVDTETVGQYTGLKDKNGKDIYEYNELDGAYEVIFKDLKYSLRHISNNDIIGLQDYWRDKNGEIEVTREYTKV